MKKFFSLLMALVMALSLTTVAWGAGVDCSTTCSDPDNHVAAVGTTHYTDVAEAVKAAASATDKTVTLLKNVTHSGTSIWAAGGITIDGAGYTLTVTNRGDKTQDTTSAALNASDGITVKNLTIDGGSRGIYIQKSSPFSYDIVLDNVTIVNSNRAFNTAGKAPVTLTVTNCTLAGKTSYGGSFATFTNCKFVENGAVSGDRVDLWGATVFDGCDFETGRTLNFEDFADAAAAGETIILNNCTIDDAPIVAADLATFLTDSPAGYIVGENITTDANGDITGGTFANDVSAYVADGFEMVSDGAGGFIAVEETANTSSASGLYAKATSKGATVQKNITLNFFKAVDNKVDKKTGEYVADGNVAYYMIDGVITKYAEVYTLADADMVIYTDEACKSVYMYLDVVDPFYVGDGAVTKNFGTACGQYSNDEDDGFDDEATYYTVFDILCVGVEAGAPYDAQILVNGKLVAVNAVDIPMNLHKAIYTRNDKGVITSIKCSACSVAAVKAANYAVLPEKAVMVDENAAPLWYWASATAVTPSTGKVTSAETFDAGIAMYVGMSVMAAAGSAVVLKKKD